MASKKKCLSQKEMLRGKGYIPVNEAAERTGFSIWAIYVMLETKKLLGLTIGKPPRPRRYVSIASLIDYVGSEGAKELGLLSLLKKA